MNAMLKGSSAQAIPGCNITFFSIKFKFINTMVDKNEVTKMRNKMSISGMPLETKDKHGYLCDVRAERYQGTPMLGDVPQMAA
jgi:hypothetical protein